jgi:hypothetical protein
VCKVTSSQEEDVEEAEVLNEELPADTSVDAAFETDNDNNE